MGHIAESLKHEKVNGATHEGHYLNLAEKADNQYDTEDYIALAQVLKQSAASSHNPETINALHNMAEKALESAKNDMSSVLNNAKGNAGSFTGLSLLAQEAERTYEKDPLSQAIMLNQFTTHAKDISVRCTMVNGHIHDDLNGLTPVSEAFKEAQSYTEQADPGPAI